MGAFGLPNYDEYAAGDGNYLFPQPEGPFDFELDPGADETVGVALIGWSFMSDGAAQLTQDLRDATRCQPRWACILSPPEPGGRRLGVVGESNAIILIWSLDTTPGGGDPKGVMRTAFQDIGLSNEIELFVDYGYDDYDLYFDQVGNIAWGATLNHIGYPRSVAQPLQQGFGDDDGGDRLGVDLGYELYDKFGEKLTFGHMVWYLEQNLDRYEALPETSPFKNKIRPR